MVWCAYLNGHGIVVGEGGAAPLYSPFKFKAQYLEIHSQQFLSPWHSRHMTDVLYICSQIYNYILLLIHVTKQRIHSHQIKLFIHVYTYNIYYGNTEACCNHKLRPSYHV